jgi:hypothetical protein
MTMAPTLNRREALGAAIAAGGAAAGGVLLAGPGVARSRRTTSGATAALNEVLRVEHVQAALYAQANAGGALRGELAAFARLLADQERRHVAALAGLLGADADPAPKLRLGDAVRDPDTFSRAARELEDLAAHAYNAQALHLSGRALREVLRIVSVEARHAAWIRDVRGETPAPDAVEPAASTADLRGGLQRTGLLV